MPNEREPRPWDAFDDAEPGDLSDPLGRDPAQDPLGSDDSDRADGEAGDEADDEFDSGIEDEFDALDEALDEALDDDESDEVDAGDGKGDDGEEDEDEDEDAQETGGGPGIDPSNLLLIVVGAHLRAEVADRPLAYRLQAAVHRWVTGHASELGADAFLPVVCSDIWYVNHPSLQRRPTISVGGPGVNALSAYFTDKLNAASVEENRYLIQLDPEFVDLRASIWGMNHELTVQALDTFQQRYLDGFLRAVGTQVEPKHD